MERATLEWQVEHEYLEMLPVNINEGWAVLIAAHELIWLKDNTYSKACHAHPFLFLWVCVAFFLVDITVITVITAGMLMVCYWGQVYVCIETSWFHSGSMKLLSPTSSSWRRRYALPPRHYPTAPSTSSSNFASLVHATVVAGAVIENCHGRRSPHVPWRLLEVPPEGLCDCEHAICTRIGLQSAPKSPYSGSNVDCQLQGKRA